MAVEFIFVSQDKDLLTEFCFAKLAEVSFLCTKFALSMDKRRVLGR